MADEALTCLTSLLQSVPAWIIDLENILKSARERQHELRAADPSATVDRTPDRPRSKTSSMKSARSHSHASKRKDGHRPRQHADANPSQLSQLTRKLTSVISGGKSGPSEYRIRSKNTVYFDGATQKQFEQLVRSVGSSRYAIRRGKMSAKVDALSRTGSSSSDCSSSGDGGDDFSPITANLKFKSTQVRSRPMASFARDDGSAAFDNVDGHLEKAQAQCERAAHQILRSGDCSFEITIAKEHFTNALKAAEIELPAIRRRARKAAERQRRSEERARVEEEAEQRLRAAAPILRPTNTLKPIIPILTSESSLVADTLEVDDDSDDNAPDLDIGSLQIGKFGPYRGSTRAPPALPC